MPILKYGARQYAFVGLACVVATQVKLEAHL